MSEFFAFENLTWPEVQELPRCTPLVLPLGSGYRLDALASALQSPPKIGILPPLPFGWHASQITVPEVSISSYIHNLLDSLRDDGFVNVFTLTPQGIDLHLGTMRIAQTIPTKPDLFTRKDLDKVVIIPIGHTEQHAYHLPLSTDTLIIDAIARGVVSRVPEQAITLPVMPYGVTLGCASRLSAPGFGCIPPVSACSRYALRITV